MLADSQRERWPVLVEEIAGLRPEMPAIGAASREALRDGDVRAVLRRADAERRRVAAAAAAAMRRHGGAVATISNSSLVARAFLLRPEYKTSQELLDEVTKRGGEVTLPTVSKACSSLAGEPRVWSVISGSCQNNAALPHH